MIVFVDTSAIAALLIKNDSNHLLSVDILKRLTEQGAELTNLQPFIGKNSS